MSSGFEDKMIETFREEAEELLTELEDSLLALESSPDDDSLIHRAFRALHTLKGSGGMFGFDAIANTAHELETVFDHIRHGTLQTDQEIIDVALRAKDALRECLSGSEGPDETALENGELMSALRDILNRSSNEQEASTSEAGRSAEAAGGDGQPRAVYRIRFRPPKNLFRRGTDPLPLLAELRSLGDCEIVAHPGGVPALENLDPAGCYVYWDMILVSHASHEAIRDVFMFVEEDSHIQIERIDEPADEAPKKLGGILVERGDIEPDQLEEVLREKQPLGRILVEGGLVHPEAVESALLEQKHVRTVRQRRDQEEITSTVRVHLEKLDTLVDLVGELVTSQAKLNQTVQDEGRSDLTSIAEEVERYVGELREVAMSMRMVPIGTTFNRFFRVVRDLSRELHKDVSLYTEGGETELDKRVIEKLTDPLIHLIRNAVDHGLEPPETRIANGKSAQGAVRLRAEYVGGMVVVHVQDDGKGLDESSILHTAIERGLVAAGTELSRDDTLALILEPGFSTSAEVTDLSGRGVGMDVVKRTVEGLGGSLSVTSEPGSGTTVSLKIPLTLAIIDGLLVRIGEQRYVVPLGTVDECLEVSREEIETDNGKQLLEVRNSLLPYVNLRQMFGINGTRPERSQIVVSDAEQSKVGLVVDEVIGQFQTVIKNLGKMYRDVQGVSGATILGDGTVALILDVSRLAEVAAAAADERRIGQERSHATHGAEHLPQEPAHE